MESPKVQKVSHWLSKVLLEGKSLPIVTTSGPIYKQDSTIQSTWTKVIVVNTPSLNYAVVAHNHVTSGHISCGLKSLKSHLKENGGCWMTRTYCESWVHRLLWFVIIFHQNSIPYTIHSLASHEILRTMIAKMYEKADEFSHRFWGVFIWKSLKSLVYHPRSRLICPNAFLIGLFQLLPHQECASFSIIGKGSIKGQL